MRIMRAILFLFALVYSFQTTAQESSTITPAELINLHSQQLRNSAPITLFSTQNDRNTTNIELDDFELLKIQTEERSALLHSAPEVANLIIPRAEAPALSLDLVRVVMPEFNVVTASDNASQIVDQAIHYRGVITNEPGSVVALSIWEGEIAGMISSSRLGGNLILGKMEENQDPDDETYILYQDKEIFQNQLFSCGTPDSGTSYTEAELREVDSGGRGPGDCVRIYLEVDYDIYQNKGGLNASTQYVTALFNQVATLYANDAMSLVLSELLVWDVPSPYTGATSGDMLTQFQGVRTSFNGDLGQLVSFSASGGIAVVDGLCHPFSLARLSYAGISSVFEQVPTYSWSVMVMAHELGHLLGSQHTHACVWNGNGTAIDSCPGYTEGGCSSPGSPSNGGTIMSYCHLSSTGINFSNGFGSQPGTLMRNNILAATCTTTCPGGGGNGGGGGDPDPNVSCNEQQLVIQVKLDTYSPETTWSLKNGAGVIVASGGPYVKPLAGNTLRDTLCLPQGCYAFTIYDTYGDGICCDYGAGHYLLRDATNQIIATGGEFPSSEQVDFCLPYDPSSGGDDCVSIDFADYNVVPYGTNQDAGSYQVQDNGNVLFIQNNAWKSIALDYEVTANTVVAFDFRSTLQGEIHGLGFDDNDGISYGLTFKVHGLQGWGLNNYDNYNNDGNWQSYVVPVGQHYQGQFDRMFFVADHDGGARNGNSWFRNVRIYEGTDCTGNLDDVNTSQLEQPTQGRLQVYPNPVINDQLQLNIDTPVEGEASWQIIAITGQQIRQQSLEVVSNETNVQIPVGQLLPGAYLIRWRDSSGEQSARFTVQR